MYMYSKYCLMYMYSKYCLMYICCEYCLMYICCEYCLMYMYCELVMCDTYRYIEISKFSFHIVIQYWLLGVSIHWCGQFSKHGFSHLSNFIPKSNCNKLVCITLIDHFLTNTTNYYFKYRDTVSYRDIFGSDTQYYYLVVSHIPTVSTVLCTCTVLREG